MERIKKSQFNNLVFLDLVNKNQPNLKRKNIKILNENISFKYICTRLIDDIRFVYPLHDTALSFYI